MPTLRVEIDTGNLDQTLNRFRDHIRQSRSRLTRQLANDALTLIIQRTPVESARARASWVESLENLGSTPPPNWQGATPVSQAIAEGRQLGALGSSTTDKSDTITFSSSVSYINYLEFGTTRIAPIRMVHSALQTIANRLRQ